MTWDFIKAKLLMWQNTAKLTMHACMENGYADCLNLETFYLCLTLFIEYNVNNLLPLTNENKNRLVI